MILIVGLGNPGQKFQKTRHNLGFRVVDEFIRKNNFPDFKFSKRFNAEISEGSLNNAKIVITKPQTFMNNSGQAVKILIDFYKISSPSLVIIHDDIDLSLTEFKISIGRGAAGHKGVESIIKELGTKNFIRFRIGIQPVYRAIKLYSHKAIEAFVLQKFNKEEEKIVKKVIRKTIEAIKFTISKGIEKAMSRYN